MLFPQDGSATGYWVDNLFYLALCLTSIAFFLVLVALIYFLIRYRSREGHKAHYTHGNSAKALWLTLALALLVFFGIDVNLAYHDHLAWKQTWENLSTKSNALHVEIMPQQFVWNIRYAGPDEKFRTEDDVVTINQLHVPINRPVIAALRSKDVIHSFFLPNFRVKQDAVPGLVTMVSFQPAKTGAYDIACAEHCGLGHYRMRGILTVESDEAFQGWLSQQHQTNPPDVTWGWDWEKRIPA